MTSLAAAVSGPGQARGHRQVRPGPGHRRPEGHQGRAQREGRRPSRDAVLGRQPCPRVDRGRGRPAHADVVAGARRRARDRRPAGPLRALVPADPEPGRLRLHLHLRHRLPHRQQPDVRRHAGDRPGRPAARHLRLQDRRRRRPRAQRRAAEHRPAHADAAPVAQDAARQRRQRGLRRRPGRRRPEPQLPDGVGPRPGGREQRLLGRDLPRPVPALGARGSGVRPAAAPDHARRP